MSREQAKKPGTKTIKLNMLLDFKKKKEFQSIPFLEKDFSVQDGPKAEDQFSLDDLIKEVNNTTDVGPGLPAVGRGKQPIASQSSPAREELVVAYSTIMECLLNPIRFFELYKPVLMDKVQLQSTVTTTAAATKESAPAVAPNQLLDHLVLRFQSDENRLFDISSAVVRLKSAFEISDEDHLSIVQQELSKPYDQTLAILEASLERIHSEYATDEALRTLLQNSVTATMKAITEERKRLLPFWALHHGAASPTVTTDFLALVTIDIESCENMYISRGGQYYYDVVQVPFTSRTSNGGIMDKAAISATPSNSQESAKVASIHHSDLPPVSSGPLQSDNTRRSTININKAIHFEMLDATQDIEVRIYRKRRLRKDKLVGSVPLRLHERCFWPKSQVFLSDNKQRMESTPVHGTCGMSFVDFEMDIDQVVSAAKKKITLPVESGKMIYSVEFAFRQFRPFVNQTECDDVDLELAVRIARNQDAIQDMYQLVADRLINHFRYDRQLSSSEEGDDPTARPPQTARTATIQTMARMAAEPERYRNRYFSLDAQSAWILYQFALKFAINPVFANIAYLRVIGGRLDLLIQLSDDLENILLYFQEQLSAASGSLIRFQELQRLTEVIDQVLQQTERILCDYKHYFPGNKPEGMLDTIISIALLLKNIESLVNQYLTRIALPSTSTSEEYAAACNKFQFTEEDQSRYLKTLIQRAINADYYEGSFAGAEEINIEQLFKTCRLIENRIEEEYLYADSFVKLPEYLQYTALLYYERLASDIDLAKDVWKANESKISSTHVLELCGVIRKLTDRIQHLFPAVEFQPIDMQDIGHRFVGHWLEDTKVKLMEWCKDAINLDTMDPVSESTPHSSSVVDLFSACFGALEFIKQSEFMNEETLFSLRTILCDVALEYAQRIYDRCTHELENPEHDEENIFNKITQLREKLSKVLPNTPQEQNGPPLTITNEYLIRINNLEASRRQLLLLFDAEDNEALSELENCIATNPSPMSPVGPNVDIMQLRFHSVVRHIAAMIAELTSVIAIKIQNATRESFEYVLHVAKGYKDRSTADSVPNATGTSSSAQPTTTQSSQLLTHDEALDMYGEEAENRLAEVFAFLNGYIAMFSDELYHEVFMLLLKKIYGIVMETLEGFVLTKWEDRALNRAQIYVLESLIPPLEQYFHGGGEGIPASQLYKHETSLRTLIDYCLTTTDELIKRYEQIATDSITRYSIIRILSQRKSWDQTASKFTDKHAAFARRISLCVYFNIPARNGEEQIINSWHCFTVKGFTGKLFLFENFIGLRFVQHDPVLIRLSDVFKIQSFNLSVGHGLEILTNSGRKRYIVRFILKQARDDCYASIVEQSNELGLQLENTATLLGKSIAVTSRQSVSKERKRDSFITPLNALLSNFDWLLGKGSTDNVELEDVRDEELSEAQLLALLQKFKLPEDQVLIRRFRCGRHSVNGVLYVFNGYLCFESPMAAKETVIVPHTDILDIVLVSPSQSSSNSSNSNIQHGAAIKLKVKDRKKFIFDDRITFVRFNRDAAEQCEHLIRQQRELLK